MAGRTVYTKWAEAARNLSIYPCQWNPARDSVYASSAGAGIYEVSVGSYDRIVDGVEYPTVRLAFLSTTNLLGFRRVVDPITTTVYAAMDVYIPEGFTVTSWQFIVRDDPNNDSLAGDIHETHGPVTPGEWSRIWMRFTPKPGRTITSIYMTPLTPTPIAPGFHWEWTRYSISEQGTQYFDGDNIPAGLDSDIARVEWTGTPNITPSVLERRDRNTDSPGTGIGIYVGDAAPLPIRTVVGYSVTEDSTPLDPSDSTGGFGQISVEVREFDDMGTMLNEPLALTDGALGETVGTIRQVEGNGLMGRMTADSRLGLLAVERDTQPFIGTLGDGIRYYLSLCGIEDGIVVGLAFEDIEVRLPGGRVNVYDRMRQLGAAYGFEMSLVSNNVVIREPHTREAVLYRDSDVTWSLDQSQFAQSVMGYYYESWEGPDIAYPVQKNAADAQVYQVDAGEIQVFEIPIDASLSSVTQPTPVSLVPLDDFSGSKYCVTTVEGDVIDPQLWTNAGGRVTVEVGPDTRTLIITIQGAGLESLAPFRIATPLGGSRFATSLRVMGEGIFWKRKELTLYIHDNKDLAPDEVGAVVDNDFMMSQDQLYHRLLLTAERYGTDQQVINVTAGGINRLGESGSARYATIGDVNEHFPGATIGDVYEAWGPTIADWNANALALVADDFANQAFGNVNGARVRRKNSYYRIRSAVIEPRSVRYSAERANTIGDVYHTGETIGEWNERWAGKTIHDVNTEPLL